MADAVAAAVSDGEFWKQFDMSPTCVETSSNDACGLEVVTVSLTQNHDVAEQRKRTMHKLCADVPARDIRPPLGIHSEVLEATRLAFSIRGNRKRKQRKTCKGHVALEPDLGLEMPLSAQAFDETYNDELLDTNLADECIYVRDDSHLIPPPDFDDCLLEDFADETLLQEGEEAMDRTMRGCPTMGSWHHIQPSPHLRKRAPSTGEGLRHCGEKSGMEEIMQLIDFAMRLSISGSPQRSRKGVRVTRQDPHTRLSSLAPSLWLPGYLPAVSSRAVLLPTISHALVSVGAKCPGLRSKVESSARQYGTAELGAIVAEPEQSLSACLWRMLQKGCYNPDAASRLKSFRHDRGGLPGQSAGSSEPILDEASATYSRDGLEWAGSEMDEDFCESETEFEEDLFGSTFPDEWEDGDDDDDLLSVCDGAGIRLLVGDAGATADKLSFIMD